MTQGKRFTLTLSRRLFFNLIWWAPDEEAGFPWLDWLIYKPETVNGVRDGRCYRLQVGRLTLALVRFTV